MELEMLVKLNQHFITHGLNCPEGKPRIEYICDQLKNFFVEVRSTSQGAGSYYVRYRDKTTTKTTRYVKIGRTTEISLAEARAKAKSVIAEIALGADPRAAADAQKAVPTVSVFFREHYLPHALARKRSYARDEEMFRLRIEPEFGSMRMNQVTRKQVQLFHTGLLKVVKPATADRHLALARAGWNLAVEWGMLDSSPLKGIPLFNPDNRVENILDDAQLEKLLTVLQTDSNRTVCRIALYLLSTGCRLNEALSAKWNEIDKPNRVWRIPATNSKSKRVRSVPLNDSALGVLNELDTEGTFEYLFVNLKTREPYGRIHKAWHRIRKVAGVPFLRIHDLRHGFASFLVNSGRSFAEIQQILGHSDPKVTMRYAHLSSRSLQEASNTASKIIAAASAVPPVETPVRRLPPVEIAE